MSEELDRAALSLAPTELGADVDDEDGLRLSPRVDLAPGLVLGGHYRIEACIGVGGMATVFRARHVELDQPVAIKVLGEELARKPALVKRFLREARAASTIHHENVVEITDFGYVRDDLPYYVMEYLEGESLAARLRREGRLSWPQARHITRQICDALGATHEGGVVHRDMKPDNVILVEREGDRSFVKVLDFGIAKVLHDDGPQGLTRTGVIMGTAAYMSPEQAKSQAIDARTDLYAVGVMLYEMLAGRVPFDGDGVMEVLTQHITDPVPSLRRISPGTSAAVERLVFRALHKDRTKRYASAQLLIQALDELGEDGRGSRGRWRLVIAGAAVVSAAAVAIWIGSASPPPAPAPVVTPQPEQEPESEPVPVPVEVEPASPGNEVDRSPARGRRARSGSRGSLPPPPVPDRPPEGSAPPSALPSLDDPEGGASTTGSPRAEVTSAAGDTPSETMGSGG